MSAGFKYAFLHGVASGDPDDEGAVLWTRLTQRTQEAAQRISLRWFVYDEGQGQADKDKVVDTGVVEATRERDWTVKVVVNSLKPASAYTFVFECIDDPSVSPVGRFKTLPALDMHVEKLRYAIFSCSNYGWGYFNAYDAASRIKDLDFVLHLGDYYYEYGSHHYPSTSEAVRWEGLEPEHEAVTLEDYRRRHATYRRDPDLQKLTASTPLIAIWDDHEVANNQYTTGAENHQPETEGSFDDRKKAAIQAYHEWLPTRSGAIGGRDYTGEKYFRKFDFGDLASLMVMETRMLNRTNPDEKPNLMDVTADKISTVSDIFKLEPEVERELLLFRDELDDYRRQEQKSLLSSEELDWIRKETASSVSRGARWQLYAQQIVMADLRFADFEGAIEEAKRQGKAWDAENWKEQLDDAMCTSGTNVATSYAPTAYLADQYLKPQNLSTRDCLSYRADFLHGKYGIPFNLDQWSGYLAERERFFSAIKPSQNSVVYSGDSHNAWASNLRSSSGEWIAAEYAGTSVSSTGWESFIKYVSPELLTSGFQAANPDLVYANTKGNILSINFSLPACLFLFLFPN